MKIAGIDVSTKAIDLVLLNLDDDQAEWHHYDLNGVDLIDRIAAIRFWPPSRDVFESVLAYGIERPAGHHAVAQVSMAFGAVLTRLPPLPVWKAWQPAEWRKACGLKGNATKVDVARWSRSKQAVSRGSHAGVHGADALILDFTHPVMDWPQDAFDAYCIAYATRSVLERVADGKAAA